MNIASDSKKRKFITGRNIMVAFLAVILIVGVVYLNDYDHADTTAIAAYETSVDISQKINDDNTICYFTDNAKTGFIFYPGGKVEYTAYEPLMKACAAKDIFCVLVKMPFNLAVFDVDAAKGIQEKYPNIEKWYIGGHSLGGSMAASYLGKHTDEYEGLVLLGSYSTTDLSESSLRVLSVYGSEDQVLNHEKYEENQSNLPDDFSEVLIEGGCHAYFGMYGKQEGDGMPTISNEEQINQTADAIIEIME